MNLSAPDHSRARNTYAVPSFTQTEPPGTSAFGPSLARHGMAAGPAQNEPAATSRTQHRPFMQPWDLSEPTFDTGSQPTFGPGLYPGNPDVSFDEADADTDPVDARGEEHPHHVLPPAYLATLRNSTMESPFRPTSEHHPSGGRPKRQRRTVSLDSDKRYVSLCTPFAISALSRQVVVSLTTRWIQIAENLILELSTGNRSPKRKKR